MTQQTASVPRWATQVKAFALGHWMTPFTPHPQNKALKCAICQTCGAKIILDTHGGLFAGVAHKTNCPKPKRKVSTNVAV